MKKLLIVFAVLFSLTGVDIVGAVPHTYDPFEVKGNFCADEERCDTNGTRTFRVCDNVGNCTDTEVLLNNYDPIAPSALRFALELLTSDNEFRTELRASDSYFPHLEFVDPSVAQSSTTAEVVGSQAFLESDKYAQLFDVNACGTIGSPFEEDTGIGICVMNNIQGVPTCESLGNCPDACPAGFVWDAGLNRCEPASTCEATSFTPEVSDICSGIPFSQISNCGTAHSAIGTKDCAAGTCTETWGRDPDTVCAGESFTQVRCSESRAAVGTKDCKPACNPKTVFDGKGTCSIAAGIDGEAKSCSYKSSRSASNVACKLRYRARDDSEWGPWRETSFSGSTTFSTGLFSEFENGHNRSCDDGSVGCGLQVGIQCQGGIEARVGYQFQTNRTESVLRYTPYTTRAGQWFNGPVSAVVHPGRDFCDNGGCGIRLVVEDRTPNASCDVEYRYKNEDITSALAKNGKWALVRNDGSDRDDCDAGTGCGMQAGIRCVGTPQSTSSTISRTCNAGNWTPEDPTQGDWTIGAWSDCSVACGTGTQKRAVNCNFDSCGPKPSVSKSCILRSCGGSGRSGTSSGGGLNVISDTEFY